MRIKNLLLKNIGAFKDESLAFIKDSDSTEYPPVTIITGDNGSGKSIILDAIRYLLWGAWHKEKRERSIVAKADDFFVSMAISLPKNDGQSEDFVQESRKLESDEKSFDLEGSASRLARHFNHKLEFDPLWFFDYWTSKLSSDSFSLSSITSPDVKQYLNNSLTGIHSNKDLSQAICFFDYLKTSASESEKTIGEDVFEAIKRVIEISVTNGNLAYVSRINLQPIVRLNGKELSLEKLSSGNLYILQRLTSLVFKAYSVIILNRKTVPYKSVFDVPGVLLIDEAENHLHPKWQKTLLKNIVELFPRVQIIVTTHSPFIVSSVNNANIYVCKVDSDGAKIVDETDRYSNMPVDEILTTDLFGTLPFNVDISDLIRSRFDAIERGNKEVQTEIENMLIGINPRYFSYFNLDEQLKSLYK
jgi:predicted ATP-binding protein involved in virulence